MPNSSQELPETPSVTIKFSVNNTFVVRDPLFAVNDSQVGFLKLSSLFTFFKLNICVDINRTFEVVCVMGALLLLILFQ